MSDEQPPRPDPGPAEETPAAAAAAAEEGGETTDTSRSVTTSDPGAAAEGPNSAAGHGDATGGHATTTAGPENYAASGSVGAGSTATTAGTSGAASAGAGSSHLPGPFVTPSSYLRPLSTTSRPQSHQGQGHGGNEQGVLSPGRQMAVRKASNPVDREQIEGLVSLPTTPSLVWAHAHGLRLARKKVPCRCARAGVW